MIEWKSFSFLFFSLLNVICFFFLSTLVISLFILIILFIYVFYFTFVMSICCGQYFLFYFTLSYFYLFYSCDVTLLLSFLDIFILFYLLDVLSVCCLIYFILLQVCDVTLLWSLFIYFLLLFDNETYQNHTLKISSICLSKPVNDVFAWKVKWAPSRCFYCHRIFKPATLKLHYLPLRNVPSNHPCISPANHY